MDTGSTTLDEQLGKLHDGSQTAVASVGVSNDRTQVVNVGNVSTLASGCSHTLLALFPVVEKLCHEQLVDLARHGVLQLHKYAPIFLSMDPRTIG
jgi:hypothetical protein